MTELLQNLLEIYASNTAIYFPLLMSVFVLGVATGLAQLTRDNLLRAVIIFATGVICLLLASLGNEPFGAEYFLNLSTELFGALAVLAIAGAVAVFDDWVYVFGGTLLVAVFSLLLFDRNDIANTFPLVMSTELIGAFLAVVLLRKDWAWSPEQRDSRLVAAMQGKSGSKKTRRAAAEDEQRVDFYVLVPGDDTAAIQQRLDFLQEHKLSPVHTGDVTHDDQTDTFYQRVDMRIDSTVDETTGVFLNNREARLRVLAYPDTAKRIYAQLGEVLTLSNRRRLDSPAEMVHFEVQTQAPASLFSAYLQREIYDLVEQWRMNGSVEQQAAIDPLLTWAKEHQFIRD